MMGGGGDICISITGVVRFISGTYSERKVRTLRFRIVAEILERGGKRGRRRGKREVIKYGLHVIFERNNRRNEIL